MLPEPASPKISYSVYPHWAAEETIVLRVDEHYLVADGAAAFQTLLECAVSVRNPHAWLDTFWQHSGLELPMSSFGDLTFKDQAHPARAALNAFVSIVWALTLRRSGCRASIVERPPGGGG